MGMHATILKLALFHSPEKPSGVVEGQKTGMRLKHAFRNLDDWTEEYLHHRRNEFD
jgi:hypothetical protein